MTSQTVSAISRIVVVLGADEVVGAVRGAPARARARRRPRGPRRRRTGATGEPSPAIVSGSPASARSTNAGTTAAGRARGPYGMPKRRTVYSTPVELAVGAAVQLAGQLRRRVEVRRRAAAPVLVVAARPACPSRPRSSRRRSTRPTPACARRLEHVQRPARVAPLGLDGSARDRVRRRRPPRGGRRRRSRPSPRAAASRSPRSPMHSSTSAGRATATGAGRRSAADDRRRSSRSTTCEPMNPAPPVTSTSWLSPRMATQSISATRVRRVDSPHGLGNSPRSRPVVRHRSRAPIARMARTAAARHRPGAPSRRRRPPAGRAGAGRRGGPRRRTRRRRRW